MKWRVIATIDELPVSGCYAIFHDSQLVYIGSSVNLPARISSYFRIPKRPRRGSSGARWRADVAVSVKVAASRKRGDWLMREYRLIARLRPRDNKLFTGSLRPRRAA